MNLIRKICRKYLQTL